MPGKSREDYLGAIYELEEAGCEAKTGDLAARLSVREASVTEMLGKLAEEGYIAYEPYKGAKLTAKGRRIAEKIKRRHRIIERFLYDVLGIRKEKVHEQACGMEHVVSGEVEKAMEDMLNNPTECPDDGKPIPPAQEDGRHGRETT
jgi:DtxR family Mn-dependent transcriptional regulator